MTASKAKFDPLKLVARDHEREKELYGKLPADQRYQVYTADPAKVYPAVVAHIQSAELERTPGTGRWFDAAKQLLQSRAGDFDLAGVRTKDVKPAQREKRAAVLEAARCWFTAALREAAGAAIHIHWIKADDWRL